jgi:uncharacterized SAM-dependent methyltransferase
VSDLARAAFARSVVRGLDDTPRWLSCRYLYDAEGSDLFERIASGPDYLTRRDPPPPHAREICGAAAPSALVEKRLGKKRASPRAWAARPRYVLSTSAATCSKGAGSLAQALRR